MKKLFGIAGIVLLFLAGGLAYQKWLKNPSRIEKVVLKVAGSGSAGFALEKWAALYVKNNPQVQFEFLPSAEAAIGISGVKEKSLDIGVTSRKAKPEEEFPGIEQTFFAKDAVVFAVNKSVNKVTNLTGQQLADIYKGKITNWQEVGGDNAKIIVVDREEKESAKKTLRELYLKDAKVTAKAVTVNSDAEVLSALVSTANSIGYLSYGRAKPAELRILAVDGVGVVEGMGKGTYRMTRDYWVITRDDSTKAVKDFVKFLIDEGQDLTEGFYYFKS